jgi:ABC-type amino acid transport substrate-binding protein
MLENYHFQLLTRVLHFQDPPFVMKRKGNFSGNDRWEGFLIDLIEAIAKELKFKYELYEVPDGNYGGLTPSGEWNGMIKEVMMGVSFIGAYF